MAGCIVAAGWVRCGVAVGWEAEARWTVDWVLDQANRDAPPPLLSGRACTNDPKNKNISNTTIKAIKTVEQIGKRRNHLTP